MSLTVDYFFAPQSPYAYLGHERFAAIVDFNVLTTFRLPDGVTYPALHDAMKRRGYIIYAGQGEIAKYGFRVANMGTLTPDDMKQVVVAFAASIEELGRA